MTKRIVVKLGPNGEIKVEAEGFVGASCEEATKFLEKVYDAKTSFSAKHEYFVEGTIGDEEQVGGYCG